MAVVLACGLTVPAGAATPSVTEFSTGITANAHPQGIAAGPDGNLWFTEFGANKIGRITPAGVVTEFSSGMTANAQPFDITEGPDGNMWFTEFGANKIGKITPSGTISELPISLGSGPQGIATGADGNLWFALHTSRNLVGRMTPAGSLTTIGLSANADPVGVALAADGNIWVAESGINSIARIAPGTPPTTTEIGAGGSGGSNPTGLAAGADANLWYSEPNFNRVSRLDLPDGGGTSFAPVANSGPRGIAAGPDGAMWFAETVGNKIGRITPAGVQTDFGDGITGTAAPFGIAAGPDGNLWFTEFGTSRIGRINTAQDPPRFSAPGAIAVPAGAPAVTSGPAGPYPATIDVSGLQGTVTRVRARLNGIHHTRASDLEVLLVGPQGQSSLLLSDPRPKTGDGLPANGAVTTFADGGETLEGQLVSGVFAPRRFFDDPTLPAPAPAGPYTTALSTFAGTDPNGTWKLFVNDGASNDTGSITGGWSLDIETTGPPTTTTVQLPGTTTTTQLPGTTQTVTQTLTGATPPALGPASLTLGKVPTKLTLSAFLKGFKVSVTPDKPAALDIALSGTTKKATLAAVRVELFDKALAMTSGDQTVTVKPSRRAVGHPKKAFKVRLRITATSGSGDITRSDRTIKITPVKRKR